MEADTDLKSACVGDGMLVVMVLRKKEEGRGWKEVRWKCMNRMVHCMAWA
jgi:hypothetical protein